MGIFKVAIASFLILMGVLMIGLGIFNNMFIDWSQDETGVTLWTMFLLLGCVLGGLSIDLGIRVLTREI
jgi:multisubunit Na+/H+ antiporter MnhG subunit